MKKIKSTTHKITNKLMELKLSRLSTTSVCDKTMSTFNVSEIPIGNVANLTIMNGIDDETSEEFEQVVIETVDGAVYSTCSMSAISLVDELINMINDSVFSIADIGFTFEKITTKNGNNCCACSLI